MVAIAHKDPAEGSRWLTVLAATRAWLFLVLVLVFFEVWAQTASGRTFVFNTFALQSIAVAAVIPLLLALGQTMVIISGGIDLSVGFILGFASVMMATITRAMQGWGYGPEVSVLVGFVGAILLSAVPGIVNGLLISRLRVPPFIGTLGMYGVARGIAFLAASGTTVPVSNSYLTWIGNGRIYGVPVSVIIAIVLVLVTHYVLSQTRFGQYTYAIGGNRQAAARAGIRVGNHTLKLYLIAALFAAVAGIIYTGRFTAGAAQAGEPLLLNSIAAVVIGGASLFGGSGTVIGTLIGALIIAVIEFGLVFINVEPFWQFVAVGVVIVISVLVDQSQKRLSGTVRDE